MDYLILNNESVANDAHRKVEANFLRYHSAWQYGNGYGWTLKNLSGAPVDPRGKTDAQLLDGADLVMQGEKSGRLNTVDGFTERWSSGPIQRLTDGKWCLPLPEEEPKAGPDRATLLFAVPQPNSIETDPDDGTWFVKGGMP